VSLPFIKPEDANHWMSIQGVVIEIIDEDDHVHGATVTASLNDTSQAYLGEGTYPMRDPAAIGYHRSRTTDSAPAEGAFTATVAQNYFTLSLTPMVISEVLKIGNRQAALNYGLNRVRFLAPARVGSRVRATVSAKSAEQKGIGLLLTFGISLENEGEREPACVADVIALFP
jgi:acyl dehydratase